MDRYIFQTANPAPLTAPRIVGDLFFGATMAAVFLFSLRKRVIEAERNRRS